LEALVAAGLAVLFLGLMLGVFVPALRYSARGQAKLELQQRSILMLSKLSQALQPARFEALSFGVGFVAVHSQQGVDSGGHPVWAPEVRFFSFDQSTRAFRSQTFPAQPPMPNRFAGLPVLSQLKTDLVVSDVELFEVTPPLYDGDDGAIEPLRVRFVLAKEYAPETPPVRLELESQISLRSEGG
jgi:hypothetical protein